MVDIARWGRGRFCYTEDAENIRRIFTLGTQLVSKESLVEEPFRPQLTAARARDRPGHRLEGACRRWGGYVATSLERNADLVLIRNCENSVLATWRYGLRRAAAFTSDAKDKWGVLWLRWPEFNKFWAQLVRWTLRGSPQSEVTATVQRADGGGEVLVDAIDARGQAGFR